MLIDSALGYPPQPSVDYLVVYLVQIIYVFIFGAVGYWRGRETQEAGNMWYLLSNLSPESREAIVELMYEEVKQMASSQSMGSPELSSFSDLG